MTLDRRISIAPMMDWTDRHCRYFHRLIAPHALLYTEMIHANAILRGDIERHLAFSLAETPVALQLGGIDPMQLREAAKRGEEYGYAEINLNCGCPSDRVQSGSFGACLMAEPLRVAEALAEMQSAVAIPVTVKTRIGIDDHESYEFLARFVDTVHRQGGCSVFILHARKAWLKGLSPKENREKPPLDWSRPHRIKRDFPQLAIVTNGGFEQMVDIAAQFPHVDGVMIGRKAYHEPYFLAELERMILSYPHPLVPRDLSPRERLQENVPLPWGEGQGHEISRAEIVSKMIDYMHELLSQNMPLKFATKHMFGLFHAQPVSKAWKHALMAAAHDNGIAPLEAFSR